MAILNKKLPTIIGLFILVIGLIAGVFLVKQRQLLTPKASLDKNQPQNVVISNISTDSFTVSFTTAETTPAYLLVSNNSDLKIDNSAQFIDNRDQLTGDLGNYKTHYITVVNGKSYQNSPFQLEPNKSYYFKIGLGTPVGTKKLFDNSGQAFKMNTANTPINKGADLIGGTVIDSNGQKINNALVYLSMPGASPLADYTKQGRFGIPINTAYSSDLTQAASYDPLATIIEIVIKKDGKSSTVKSVTGTKNIPEVILGQNYDLTKQVRPQNVGAQNVPGDDVDIPTPAPKTKKSGFGANNLGTQNLDNSKDLAITNPSKENEILSTQKPEFSGTGPAGEVINLKIESEETINASVSVNNNGYWTYSTPQGLTPGDHTITISYLMDNGDEDSVSRNFTIISSENSDLPAIESTPSATISPTKIPTLAPTPYERSSIPSTESGIPDSGVVRPTLYIGLAAILFFALAFKLAKL